MVETINKIRTTDKISIINVVTASITTIQKELVIIKETWAVQIVEEMAEIAYNNGMTIRVMVFRISVVASKVLQLVHSLISKQNHNKTNNRKKKPSLKHNETRQAIGIIRTDWAGKKTIKLNWIELG